MNLINNDKKVSFYIDLDEQAVLRKSLELYIAANTSYTNAYDLDKKETTNLIVSKRILHKIIDIINQDD